MAASTNQESNNNRVTSSQISLNLNRKSSNLDPDQIKKSFNVPLKYGKILGQGQTRVKKQLATQSIFYGGIENDFQIGNQKQKRNNLDQEFLMHNPSEVSLGKDSQHFRDTTINSKVSLLRQTRQSTRLSQDSIGQHRPNSSIEKNEANSSTLNTIMNIETNNQSLQTSDNIRKLTQTADIRRQDSSSLRQGSRQSLRKTSNNQIFIQSNDYQLQHDPKTQQQRQM